VDSEHVIRCGSQPGRPLYTGLFQRINFEGELLGETA